MSAIDLKEVTPSRSLVINLRQQMMQVLPFSEMLPEHVDLFIESSKECYFAPDEMIVSPESGPVQSLYFIRKGSVIGRRGLANEPGSAQEIETGDLFPVNAALAGRAVTGYYSASGDCFCLAISSDVMKKLSTLSTPFADYLNQRILKFLEQSRKVLQKTYASQVFSEQSLETPLGQLPRKKPLFVHPDTPLQDALLKMHERRVGSILVSNENNGLLGILTRYDILGRVTIPQVPMSTPIKDVMTPNVFSLTVLHSGQDAALMMSKHGIRHVPVMDGNEIINVISERDLFATQRLSLKNISTSIRTAPELSDLVTCAKDIRTFARNLISQGVQARQLTGLISYLNDLVCEKLIDTSSKKHNLDPKEFAWIALGSEGRSEQTIATDQDNALVYAGKPSQDVQAKYLAFAREVNEGLDACGYPLCKGNVMASNPEICLSEGEWVKKFEEWIYHGSAENLLKASIYFDFRLISGNPDLLVRMKQVILENAPGMERFMKQIAANSLRMQVPISWLGGLDTIKLDGKQCIDLKINGTAIFVDTARVYSLDHAIEATNTRERLIAVGKALRVPENVYMGWVTGFEYLQMLRLSVQMDNKPIGGNHNAVELSALNDVDRKILKESLRIARSFQHRLETDYGQ
jgi:CBS domain-containing protein